MVVATGSKTQFGQIAKSLEDSEEETTPLQKKLDEFGELLGYRALTDSHLFLCAHGRTPTDWLMKTTFNGRAIRCTKLSWH